MMLATLMQDLYLHAAVACRGIKCNFWEKIQIKYVKKVNVEKVIVPKFVYRDLNNNFVKHHFSWKYFCDGKTD
jgi:hypothetical protein